MDIGTIRSDASGPLRMLRSVVRALQPPQVTAALDAALQVYQRGIQSRAPRKTGQLASSFTISSSGYVGEVGSNLIYAVPQERGAWIAPKKPHVALKFTGSGVFVRRPIRLRPRPYVGPTFQADTPQAEVAFQREIDRAIQN